MQIRESAEDYLEAILVLSRKGGGVRSVDIATMLGVSKPSVSHAMKLLREDGYIAMDRYGTVTLMEKGAEIANRIYERHTVLTKMLEGLGVSADTARCDACKMEHDVSDESFEKIKEHLRAKGRDARLGDASAGWFYAVFFLRQLCKNDRTKHQNTAKDFTAA